MKREREGFEDYWRLYGDQHSFFQMHCNQTIANYLASLYPFFEKLIYVIENVFAGILSNSPKVW